MSALEPTAGPPRVASRALPELLRRRFAGLERGRVSLLIGEVAAIPDAGHVTVDVGATLIVVPRLAGYATPTVGSVVYCLAADTIVIALGEVASP